MAMDEIAIEDRLCYLPETDEIAGLCEHASTALATVKMGENLDAVYRIREVTTEKKAKVAKEALVITFNRNSRTGYGARVAGVIPTCKEGDWRQMAQIIEMYRQAWKISPYYQ
jgi:hypothetical protein